MLTIIFFCLVSLRADGLKASDNLLIAVASNFKTTLEKLTHEFQLDREVEIRISSASTGILYAQIKSGAPFDLLLAADAHRPNSLARNQLGVAESRFTYALGRIVLWIPGQDKVSQENLASVSGKLSMANPKTAPYGLAAKQYLQSIGLWKPFASRTVFGSNVAQAFQYVLSGNAEAGLIALSVLKEYTKNSHSSAQDFMEIPEHLYSPIQQQAIRLINSRNADLADEFLAFLKSDRARSIIEENGYITPTRQAIL